MNKYSVGISSDNHRDAMLHVTSKLVSNEFKVWHFRGWAQEDKHDKKHVCLKANHVPALRKEC